MKKMRSTRRNTMRKGSAIDTPPLEDAPVLRRSMRVNRRPDIHSPAEDKLPKRKRICGNKKRSPSVELQRDSLDAFDRDNTPEVASDIVLVDPTSSPAESKPDVSDLWTLKPTSSPAESKPDVSDLWTLKPANEPHSEHDIPQQYRAKFMEVASILKSDLVSLLTNSGQKMSPAEMTKRAIICFNTLTGLGDDYKSFHSEICKLIEYYKNLEFAETRKEWVNTELKTRLHKQTDALSDVEEELLAAQNSLLGAVSRRDSLRSQIEEMTATLERVVEECCAEELKVSILAAKTDQCQEKHSSMEAEVRTLEKEVEVTLQGINAMFDTAKEGVEKVKNQLLRLVTEHESSEEI